MSVIGRVGWAGPAGRSLAIGTNDSGVAVLIQPSGGFGPATPRMPASTCERMSVSFSVPSRFT